MALSSARASDVLRTVECGHAALDGLAAAFDGGNVHGYPLRIRMLWTSAVSPGPRVRSPRRSMFRRP